MAEAWGGSVDNHCPTIGKLKVAGGETVAPGAEVKVATTVADADGDAVKVKWTLAGEQGTYFTNGEAQDATAEFPDAIKDSGEDSVTVEMPKQPGVYRLYAVVHDGKNAAATANVPLMVKGDAAAAVKQDIKPADTEKQAKDAPKAKLPLVVYADKGQNSPFVASGYMGDNGSIKMNADSTDDPHSGKTALRAEFDKKDGWGGVVWQSPANDWGEKRGGVDLSEAKKLTFWVRGDKGGEKVTFGIGGIGKDQPYYDTAEKGMDVTLTKEWKQYEFDLSDADLSRVKSGFKWVVAGQGEPLVFFLDDIQYE